MNAGIYCIENKLNNKIYIGQSKQLDKRLSSHKHLLENNKHFNVHLQNSYNKYGKEAFSFHVLEKTENLELLNKLENKWIGYYKSFAGKNGYNIKYPTKVFRIAFSNVILKNDSPKKKKKLKLYSKICKNCQERFYAERSRIKFCSTVCRTEYRNKKSREQYIKNHPKSKNKNETVCMVCHKKFTKTRYWQKYCSPKCRKEAFNRRHNLNLKTKVNELKKEIEELKQKISN